MTGKLSRRDILKIFTLAAGGTVLAMGKHTIKKTFTTAKANDLTTKLYFPFMATSDLMHGKVVHIHAPDATASWSGQSNYWDYVDQSVVNEMVNLGLTELTGASTVADAWRSLIPGYQSGQKVAIKVNFNNSGSCSNNTVIDALIQPVNAVVSGLEQIGVARSDVCVYDAIRHVPDRFRNGGLSGIGFYDGRNDGYCALPAGFTYQSGHYVTFNPPEGVTVGPEVVTDVLYNAAYLINMPIMKGGHPIAGVTLGYKNHFGTVDNPSGMHTAAHVVSKPDGYDPDYNPLVDLMACPLIGGKAVLTIGDGIFAARVFNEAPQPWTTFYNKVPNSLFFSTDPVAIDCVMHDYIKEEVGSALVNDANRYLQLAAAAGQGVFESCNPWSDTYHSINYCKIVV